MEITSQKKPEFIYIEACNFIDFPIGGTLSFAIQLIKVLGNRMALVGYTDQKVEYGKWCIKKIGEVEFYFFGIGIKKASSKKPLIPARLTSYFDLKRNLKKISTISINRVFTQTPQFALLLNNENWKDKCFCFAGTTNSVQISRYPLLRMLAKLYEKSLFKALSGFDVVLAAADAVAIKSLKERSNGLLGNKDIKTFSTRFDDKIFYPMNKMSCRERLNIDQNKKMFVTTGRLCWVKGWKLLLETLKEYRVKYESNCCLVFVGDGEDRTKIENYAEELQLTDSILITGMVTQEEVSLYLNSCDVYLSGSFYEGWSTAMTEALGCGCSIVTTNVSGTYDMIHPGKNGFIIDNRNPEIMAEYIFKATILDKFKEESIAISKRYSLSNLKEDFEKLWLNK